MVNKVVKGEEVQNSTGTELQILQNIEKAYYRNHEGSKKRSTEASLKWFSQYVPRAYNRVRTSQMMRDNTMLTDKIVPGNMYAFVYDPLHKDTLPFYDTFPLVFPWDTWVGDNGVTYMIGINLHLLPYALCFRAMKALLTLRNERRYRNSTRLRISWEILKGLSASKYFEHSVRMYRMDHVRSRFIRIPAQAWELAVFLPTHRIQKGGQAAAWKV